MMPRTRALVYPSVAASIFVLAASSCEPRSDDTRQKQAAHHAPARHAVASEKLAAIMARLGGTVRQTWPQEIEQEKAAQAERDRQVQFREAQQIAQSLADAAQRIPDGVAHVDLSEADRQAFMAGVELLQSQAKQLATAAADRDLRRVQATLSQIQTTCYGCHEQFNEHAGPITFGRPVPSAGRPTRFTASRRPGRLPPGPSRTPRSAAPSVA